MEFIQLFSFTFSKTENNKKILVVTKGVCEDQTIKHFIDIRVYYRPKPPKDTNEDTARDEFKPTRSGVTLNPEEFRKVLPALVQGGDAIFESRDRRLTVKPTAHPKVMRLILEKTDSEPKSIDLGLSEINKIIDNKNIIVGSMF